jgi:hypothetical protein
MVRQLWTISTILLIGCGGGKTPPKKPIDKEDKPVEAPKETEQDREQKRKKSSLAIIPEGTTCFPSSLKADQAPRLELAAINNEAVICANDIDRQRLLGPIACWRVDLASGALVYQAANQIPGRNLTVKLDDRCARGYCIPKDANVPGDKIVHMAMSPNGSKVVVIAGDDAHIYDATARARESGFSIRGDKGVTNDPAAVHWIGNAIFIEGHDQGPAGYVFGFKTDGQATGPLMTFGEKKETMLSTNGGSFVVLDENRVAIVERGFSAITSYEIDSGKRTRIKRNVTNGPCKPAEAEAFWMAGDNVPPKCKDHMTKTFGHLIGADVVAGKTNLLVLLRGQRLGELAVLDVKNLTEKKSIKLPWCEGGGGSSGAADGGEADEEADKEEKPKADKAPAKAEKKKKAPAKPVKGDPDEGGE